MIENNLENNLENKFNGNEKESKQEEISMPELPKPAEEELKIEELQKELEKYKDLFLRKAAEFENYRRRIDTETTNIIKFANETLIEQLLPIIDDIERAIKHGKDNSDYQSLLKGIELIYQKFLKVLESQGVKAFETVGKKFDVDYHDALMQVQNDDVPHHTVIEEVEKGYMMKDKVIRHAKVIVSSGSQEGINEEVK